MNAALNSLGRELQQRLEVAQTSRQSQAEQTINVANVGRVVSMAYEQLRNAAEYTQEHLLLQRAMRRYYVRNLSFGTRRDPERSTAEELIVELTQAGYLDNDTLPHSVLEKLTASIALHYENYWRMVEHVERHLAEEWTLDLMSVEAEALVSEESQKLTAYQYFAFQHFKATIDKGRFVNEGDESSYETSLYVAVHRALLKSDLANVRYDLQQLYRYPDTSITDYIAFQKNISETYESDIANKLTRFIDRHGAPLRILKAMTEDNKGLPTLLTRDSHFLTAYESQVRAEYARASERLNKGLVKSIIFLLITKALVGLLVEIPYDILVTGAIAVIPLVVNLAFPVAYLLLLRVGIKLPSAANTDAMTRYIQAALYSDGPSAKLYAKEKKPSYTVGFTVVYIAMFVFAFGFVLSRLVALDFNVPQMVLFFVFLATASFLGFRLTNIIRELELVTAKPGVIQILRDFLYMPFIVVGRWLSEEYKKVNFIALILDTVIELPLKTVLRLVRQWTSFISDKKESL